VSDFDGVYRNGFSCPLAGKLSDPLKAENSEIK
jgi:hypothetical protein